MQLFNQPCAEISKLKAAKAAAVEMLCVRSKGSGGVNLLVEPKEKKDYSAAAVRFWGNYRLSAMTRANLD